MRRRRKRTAAKITPEMCLRDLTVMAQEQQGTEMYVRGIRVRLGRMQAAMGIRQLAARWGLSTPTVQKRLRQLAEGRIAIQSSNVINIITIMPRKAEAVPATERKAEVQPRKRDTAPKKPQKISYAPEVRMTEEEHAKLVADYGEDGARWMVEKLDGYKAASGRTYKSDYRAILNWVVNEYKKNQTKQQNVTIYGGNQVYTSRSEIERRQREKEFREHIEQKLRRADSYRFGAAVSDDLPF